MKRTPSLSIGRESLLALGSKVLMAAIGFGGVVIFARELGNVGLGEYRTVLAAAFILAQVPAGTASAVKKRVSEVDTSVGQFLGAGLLFHVAFTLVTFLGVVLLRPYAARYFGTHELAIGVVLVVGALGLFNVTNMFFSGIGHPALSSWIDLARSVLTLAFQLLFLWFNLEAFGLVLGFVVATALSAGISAAAGRVVPTLPTRDAIARLYDFARWSVPNSLLTNFYGNADAIVIRAFVSAGAVGYYTVAAQLAMPAAMFATSISDALSVKTSGVDSAGGDVRADLENSVSYTGLIAIPMFFGALVIPGALMTTLFGADFSDAPGYVLVAMTLYQVGNVYRQPFEAVIAGTDRPHIMFRTNVAMVVVYLALAPTLGTIYGLAGIMTATVLAGATRIVFYQYVAYREYGGVVVTKPVGEQVVSGALMAGVVWSLTEYAVTIHNWLALLFVVGVGAATYFAALLAISAHFRTTLRYVLPWVPSPADPEP